MVAGCQGRTLSEETRAKIGDALRGRKLTDEHRAKLVEAARRRRERGRSDEEHLTVQALVPMTPAMRDKVDAAAKASGTNRAELMRHAMWLWLDTYARELEAANPTT